jgi:hypothetical protein
MGAVSGLEGAGMDCVAMTDDELVELAIEAMDGWHFWREDEMNMVELTGAIEAPFCLDIDPFNL